MLNLRKVGRLSGVKIVVLLALFIAGEFLLTHIALVDFLWSPPLIERIGIMNYQVMISSDFKGWKLNFANIAS